MMPFFLYFFLIIWIGRNKPEATIIQPLNITVVLLNIPFAGVRKFGTEFDIINLYEGNGEVGFYP